MVLSPMALAMVGLEMGVEVEDITVITMGR